MPKGKLIAIEAGDGSGKATQTALLVKHLAALDLPVKKIEFPDYASPAAAPVKMYLNGDFGKAANDVSPYAAATFFAIDRYASYQLKWRDFYQSGGLVVADRYVTSNLAHQAVKIADPAARAEFCRWLLNYEYDLLGLPRPDAVIFLDLNPAVAARLIARRATENHAAPDIHERDGEYLTRCHNAYAELARIYGWTVIKCDDGDEPQPPEDIAREVFAAACAKLNIEAKNA